MKRWEENWDVLTPMFKFSADVRKVIYTTNAIESLNSVYRRLNAQRSIFSTPTALLKALYLATYEATKKWTIAAKELGKGLWGAVHHVRGQTAGIMRYHKIPAKSRVYAASCSNERPTGALDMTEIL